MLPKSKKRALHSSRKPDAPTPNTTESMMKSGHCTINIATTLPIACVRFRNPADMLSLNELWCAAVVMGRGW
jgi:hypothetical protein